MGQASTIPYDPEDSTLGHGQIKAGASDPRVVTAWDQFYEHCFTIIRRSPGVRRLNETDREDCVQDVMMEIVRRFREAADRPSPDPNAIAPWILTVSRNKAADMVRRRMRRPETQFQDGAGGSQGEPPDLTARDEAGPDPGEYVALVWEALVALDQEVPVTSYLVFYLHTIEGWPYAEIAGLFQITEEQARVRCHRVKKKFAAIVDRQRDESA
jgi:RNA polymerase sigma factor (sigma-70 family)